MIKNLKFQGGFSLIEGVIGIAIFSIIFLSLSSLFSIVFNTILNNKARVNANSIALEQLEIVRGMDFSEVKTDLGWVPPGAIESEKMLSKNGINFTVKTDIAFIDDEFDGLNIADSFPYDYKKVRIRVIWKSPADTSENIVDMSTTVVSDGLEGLSPDKGGIFVTIFNASGETISGADVYIESISESYSINAATDLNGNLWIPDLEPSDDYHIMATKNGYSADQTYPVDTDPFSPTYNPNPVKPNAVVVANEVTALGFSIDVLGYLNIQTVNYNNPQNWKVNSDLGTDSQREVAIDIDSGNNIFLVWKDDRDGPVRMYAQKYKYDLVSGQYEKQWSDDIQITTANNKENPRVAVLGTSYFYVLGVDDRNGNKDVFLEKYNSSDGSSVWPNDVGVNLEAGNDDQTNSDVAVDLSGNAYVVWMDDRSGNWDIYVQKRDPEGVALWAADLKINSDAGSSDQENPRIVVDDENNFYVIWESEISGDKDIFLAKFDENGNTLFAGKKVNTDNSGLDQYEPSIIFDGSDYLYISWTDKRDSQPDIYVQKYDKTGNIATGGNWMIGDIKINDDSTSDAWRTKSSLAYFSDDAIYFSWEDDRNGDLDVYSAKFDSDGNKLWAFDLIMNGVSFDSQRSPDLITDSMGYAITAWEDRRDGQHDIYAARYKNFGFFLRTNVPITITGAKIKGTYPNSSPPPNTFPIYKYLETFNSDASGYINIGDGISAIEWDDYTFNTDTLHTIISMDQPDPLSIDPGVTEVVIINVEP